MSPSPSPVPVRATSITGPSYLPSPQGYPYYLPPYGYPQRNPMVQQPNQGQVNQFNQQTPPDRTTQKPQLPLQVWKRWARASYRGILDVG